MEIDEHLKYTLYVSTKRLYFSLLLTFSSLQFDPCPRAGEPMVSRSKSLYKLPKCVVANIGQGRPTISSNFAACWG